VTISYQSSLDSWLSGRKTSLVVAVSGEPASGKTAASERLARHLGGVALDSDLLTGPLRDALLRLLGLPLEAVDESLYQQQIRPAVYQCLIDTTAGLASFGVPVVVNAPFHPVGFPQEAWEEFHSAVEASGATLLRVHVVAEPDAVLQRMQSRGASRDAGKLQNWERHRAQWEVGLPNCLAVLDNSTSLDALDAQVIELAKRIRMP